MAVLTASVSYILHLRPEWNICFLGHRLTSSRLTLVLVLPATAIDNLPTGSTTTPTPVRSTPTSGQIVVVLLMLHAFLFLLSIPVGGRHQDTIFIIICNLNAGIANPIITIAAAVAYMLQAIATNNAQGLGALSNLSLVLQVATFLALAVLWPFRLVLPENLWEVGPQPVLWTQWYPWVGWACVNSAAVAIGQVGVLYVGLGLGDGNPRSASERQALLTS